MFLMLERMAMGGASADGKCHVRSVGEHPIACMSERYASDFNNGESRRVN